MPGVTSYGWTGGDPSAMLEAEVKGPLISVVVAAALVSGCGEGDAQRSNAPPATETSAFQETATPPAAGTQEPLPKRPRRSLSATELRRVTGTGVLVGRAIQRYDATLESCAETLREPCADRAWAVVVRDIGWPAFSLLKLRPRSRRCEPLATAFETLDGFNLGAVQLDYGAPGEVDSTFRRSERMALVDRLRPVPRELREAALACRR